MPDPAAQFEFDVFISYSSHDKTWVRDELLPRIEEAGLKAFVDYRDFTRGAPSIKECERGVLECRKMLMILTPDYVKIRPPCRCTMRFTVASPMPVPSNCLLSWSRTKTLKS